MIYHPTKYDSAAHEVIDGLSDPAEGYGLASTGDTDCPTGYVALVNLDETCDLDFTDHTNYPPGDPVGETARTYGVSAADVMGVHLITTNSDGFVSVETFPNVEAATEEYRCREGRYAEWDDETSDEGDVYVCPVVGHGYHTV